MTSCSARIVSINANDKSWHAKCIPSLLTDRKTVLITREYAPTHTRQETTMENTQKQEKNPVKLGDLINLFYQEYLALYGDEELASVAAAATINELLSDNIQTDSDATDKKAIEAA